MGGAETGMNRTMLGDVAWRVQRNVCRVPRRVAEATRYRKRPYGTKKYPSRQGRFS